MFGNLYAQSQVIWGNVYWDNVNESYAVPVKPGTRIETVLELSEGKLPLVAVTKISNGYLARYKAA